MGLSNRASGTSSALAAWIIAASLASSVRGQVLSEHVATGQVTPASAVSSAPLTSSSIPSPTDQSTAIDQLVVGDEYDILVRRGNVTKQCRGTLVKATDHWLVLFTHAEARTERSVPVLSKVPYVNRLFRNVGIGRATLYHWLPREASTIRGRTMADTKRELPIPKYDLPPSDTHLELEVFDGREAAQHHGKIAVNGDLVTCRFDKLVAAEKPMPVLGALPVVGGAFRTEHFQWQEETIELPLSNVLCFIDDSALDDYEALLR